MATKLELQQKVEALQNEKECILRALYGYAASRLNLIGKYEHYIAKDLMSTAYCLSERAICKVQYEAYVESIEVVEGLGKLHVEETVKSMPESKYKWVEGGAR